MKKTAILSSIAIAVLTLGLTAFAGADDIASKGILRHVNPDTGDLVQIDSNDIEKNREYIQTFEKSVDKIHTQTDAVDGNISKEGETYYVNKDDGTQYPIGVVGDAKPENVVKGYTFSSQVADNGNLGTNIAGTMATAGNNGKVLTINDTNSYTIAAGYYPNGLEMYAVDASHGISSVSYTVKFNGNGATSGSVSSQTMNYMQYYNLNANNFKRSYTITYNYNGGSGSKSSDTITYKFLGWSTTEGGTVEYADGEYVTNLSTVNGATVNLYAVWEMYGTNTYAQLPTAAKDNLTAIGWSTTASYTDNTNFVGGGGDYIGNTSDSSLSNFGLMHDISADTTLYAHYQATITFDANGGTFADG